jgi:hypothetical protein
MALHGKRSIRSKIIMDNTTITQVKKFKFLGCTLSYYEHRIKKKNRIIKSYK